MFDYFHANEQEQYLFLQLPIMLIKDDQFKGLSDGAKILYSLLLNRTSLSARNGWKDEQGRVYIIYTIEEIMSDLNCWKEKATKSMKELKEIGLIKTVRRGLGKPNLIYVMNFATALKYQPKNQKEPTNPVNTQKTENRTSVFSEIELQQDRKSNPIYIDLNKDLQYSDIKSKSKSDKTENSFTKEKTDMTMTNDNDTQTQRSLSEIKNEPSTIHDADQSKGLKESSQTNVDNYIIYKELIQENIEYKNYLLNNHKDIELIDELVNCMLDVICTEGKTVKIKGKEKDKNMVKSQYLKINSMDIEHILERYKDQHHKISRPHEYLKSMLYTVKQEIGHYNTNLIRRE